MEAISDIFMVCYFGEECHMRGVFLSGSGQKVCNNSFRLYMAMFQPVKVRNFAKLPCLPCKSLCRREIHTIRSIKAKKYIDRGQKVG
jgi:hypothetical protein